ncbi:MAG: hypothetical protein PHD12_06845 [Methylotenera sp.]|nr:hypothetical protein [Methylotenera sp.]
MKLRRKHYGMALIMLLFVIALAATAFIFSTLEPSAIRQERDKKTAEVLLQAKSALIGWSVSHPQYPGILPFPDRSADGNYDGSSDCVSSATLTYGHLIGKLPFNNQTAPCVGPALGLATDLRDAEGESLWYAVSRNLIRTTVAGGPVINPSITDAPTYPWLVVRDKNGQVISNRVAAVIIAPGLSVDAQDRSGGLAGAPAYLDAAIISAITYSNADYTVPNEDFISGEDMRNVPPTHPTYQQPYLFNDRLIYITIDELMLALEKRVVREVAGSMRNYYSVSSVVPGNRYYPYAAELGEVNHLCDEGRLEGGLPITNAASSCTHPNPGLTLPSWFTDSGWQDYFYYVVSNDCSYAVPGCAIGGITVGAQSNVHALLISAGAAIGVQARPSGNVADYLDSAGNTDGDGVFDAVGTPLSNIYNDQSLIVAP